MMDSTSGASALTNTTSTTESLSFVSRKAVWSRSDPINWQPASNTVTNDRVRVVRVIYGHVWSARVAMVRPAAPRHSKASMVIAPSAST